MKNLEVKTIEHKGVKVVVRIDYVSSKASLVEINSNYDGILTTPAKKWVFSGRGLEYMNGWLDILEAMKVAVNECKKDLEHDLAEKSAFKAGIIAEVIALSPKKRR